MHLPSVNAKTAQAKTVIARTEEFILFSLNQINSGEHLCEVL